MGSTGYRGAIVATRSTDTTAAPSTPPRWRAIAGLTLIVIGCIVAVPAVAFWWVNRQLTDREAYVTTVAPLIDDPSIQQAFADKITTAIFDHVDQDALLDSGIDSLAESGMPEPVTDTMRGLESSLAGAIQGFVNRQALNLVGSSAVDQLWVEVNSIAHDELASALAGDDSRTLRIDGDELIANTGVLSRQVKDRLVSRGVPLATFLPVVNTNVTLLDSPRVAQAQDRYQLVTTLGTVLPWVAGIALVAGLALAINRRQGLVVGGIGIAAGMLVLAAAVAIGKTQGVNAVPSNVLPRNAASTAVDIVLRSVWRPIWFLLALGAVIALVAWLAGPASAAVRVRSAVADGAAGVRGFAAKHGVKLAPVDEWVGRYQRWFLVGVAVVAGLVLLLWNAPTWGVVLWTAALAGLAVLIVVVLGTPAPGTAAKPQAEPEPESELAPTQVEMGKAG